MGKQPNGIANDSSGKMLALEGVRGIAALVVIFDHLHLAFFVEVDNALALYLNAHVPYLISKAGQYFATGLHDGNFAVWVFWVMSAFVLSKKYFQLAKENRVSDASDYLTRSAIKRYPRLFIPILASVLFAFLIMSAGWMTNNDLASRLGEHTSAGWLPTFYAFEPSFVQAFKSAAWDAFFNFNRDTTYNTVLWTMEPEFFGSIFLFGFLSLIGNTNSRWFAYPVLALIFFFRETHWLNAFVVGIALCDLYVHTSLFSKLGQVFGAWWVQVTSALLIMVLIGAPNYRDVFHLGVATLLVALTLSFNGFMKFFSARLPVYLGKISFSLYLIHVPILCSVTGLMYRIAASYLPFPASAIATSILTIALSILAAHIFYRFADKQGIILSGKFVEAFKSSNR